MLAEAYRDVDLLRMELAQARKDEEEADRFLHTLKLADTAPTTTPSPSLTAGKTPGGGGASANLRLKDLHPEKTPKVSPSSGLITRVTTEYQIQIQMSPEARHGSMRDTKITNTTSDPFATILAAVSSASCSNFTVNPYPNTTPPTVHDPYYGQEHLAKLAARFITHLFPCSDYPPPSSHFQARLPHFIAYALYRTKLPATVTFAALVLLQRLNACFHRRKRRIPFAWASSGYRLFISAYMLASKVMCDDTYSNKSWCVVAQHMFTLQEVNQMEREMYNGLNGELTIYPSELSDFEKAVREDFGEDMDLSTYPTYSTTFVSKQAAKAEESTSNTPSASPRLDARSRTSLISSRLGPDSPPWQNLILNERREEDTKDWDVRLDDSNSDDSDDLSSDALSEDGFSPRKQDVSKHFRLVLITVPATHSETSKY